MHVFLWSHYIILKLYTFKKPKINDSKITWPGCVIKFLYFFFYSNICSQQMYLPSQSVILRGSSTINFSSLTDEISSFTVTLANSDIPFRKKLVFLGKNWTTFMLRSHMTQLCRSLNYWIYDQKTLNLIRIKHKAEGQDTTSNIQYLDGHLYSEDLLQSILLLLPRPSHAPPSRTHPHTQKQLLNWNILS